MEAYDAAFNEVSAAACALATRYCNERGKPIHGDDYYSIWMSAVIQLGRQHLVLGKHIASTFTILAC